MQKEKNEDVFSLIKRSDYKNSLVKIGKNWALSIQASKYHYSHPKKDLALNSDYSAFEIAILKISKNYSDSSHFNDDKWEIIQPRDYFSGLSWVEEFESGAGPSVAGYLNADTIQQIYLDIKRLHPILWLA